MEELLIKKQISYSCIFPNGTDTLQEILKIIPSKSAIAWASYMLTRKKMMNINQTEVDFFIPLLFKMNEKLQNIITNYLQSIDFYNYVFIDEVSLLILIEYLLESHNKNDTDVFESKDDFSNMIIAYLMCCDEKLSYTTKSLHGVNNTESLMALYLPEQLRYYDIYYLKDYSKRIIKSNNKFVTSFSYNHYIK